MHVRLVEERVPRAKNIVITQTEDKANEQIRSDDDSIWISISKTLKRIKLQLQQKCPIMTQYLFSCCIKVDLSKEVILLIRKLDNMGV